MASAWQLSSWLESLSLSEYTNLFTEHGYADSSHILSVDKATLKGLGLDKVGHQNRLLRAVDKLRSELSTQAATIPRQPSSPQTKAQANGVPPTAMNSDLSYNSLQSPTATTPPTSSRGSAPPPVPLRRSIHRSTPSRVSSTLPTSPSHTTNSASQLPSQLDLPPAVKPRQQSLRGSTRSSDELSSPHNAALSCSATLPAATRLPQKSQLASEFPSQFTPQEKAVSEPVLDHATVDHGSTAPRVKPKPMPRIQRHTRSTSDHGTGGMQRPVPLPRKASGKRLGNSVSEGPETWSQVCSDDAQPPPPGEEEVRPVLSSRETPLLFPERGDHKSDISSGEGSHIPILPHKEVVHKPGVQSGRDIQSRTVSAGEESPLTEEENQPVLSEGHSDPRSTVDQSLVERKQDPVVLELPVIGVGSSGPILPLSNEASHEVPPAIPVKRSPKFQSKRIIAPSEEVIFELENEPIPPDSGTHDPSNMPNTTTNGKSQPNQATSTPDHSTKSSHLQTSGETSSIVEHHKPPPLEQISSVVVPDGETIATPPPPPHRANSVKTEPERDTTPPPPPHRANSVKKEPECDTTPPPPPPQRTESVKRLPQSTAMPQTANSVQTPPEPATTLPPHMPTASALDQGLPPLPPKEIAGPPSFSPDPPPISPPPSASPPLSPLTDLPSPPPQSPSMKIFTPPPLPPKTDETPPPPPPLSELYDTEDSDFLSDSEDEHNGKFATITSRSLSLKSPSDDDCLTLSPGHLASPPLENESDEVPASPLSPPATPPSSEEGTPRRISPMQVRQQSLEVSGNADIMVLSPEPPRILEPTPDDGDYANQEIIDGGDYVNQQIIDEAVVAEREGDYADSNKLGTIRGTTPIRSRTLTPEQCDYINQEVLDEDIIPVSLAVPSSGAAPLLTDCLQDANTETLKHDPENLDIVTRAEEMANLPTVNTQQSDILSDPKTVLQLHHKLQSSPSPQLDRRSMSPTGDHESALEFRGTSPHRLTPEHIPLKPQMSSGFSSGMTTPGSLSLDSLDYSDHREGGTSPFSVPGGQETPSVFSRMAASVYRPTGGDYFEPACLPPSSGTFACHERGRGNHLPPKKYISTGVVDFSHELTSPLSDEIEDMDNVPRTKEGYLHKKGGKRSQRPWQKRWMVFSGQELKYFNDKNYKESDALNHVNLRDMIDVKRINDAQSDKQHRFDLVVIGRVFQFYADSREDCDSWVTVLHAAIARFQPQENEKMKEGGTFHDPEKQGVLLKQGRGMRQGFRERYIALKGSKFAYYDNKEAFVNARPIHILELALANVRPDPSGKHRFIITMNNQKTYTFQAHNDLERKEWLDSITDAILAGLVGGEKAPAPPTKKETTVQDIMARIQENPANRVCADCTTVDPSWGVVNLGIMVCIECSGVHRSMGILISKVRSLELDRSIWTDSLIKLMVEIGNERSNQFWEKHCKQERLNSDVERDIRESFIRAKYQDHSWIPQPTGEDRETLSKQLLLNVTSNNLMRSIQLLAHGANVAYEDPDQSNTELKTCLAIAKRHKQDLQVELLEQNRALSSHSSKSEMTQLVSKKGHLYKTGTDRTGWKRRWCTVDQFRGLEYFRSENDPDLLGEIKIHEMLSISRCSEENSRDPKYSHCFEVITQSRGYLFCADSKPDMEDWITTLRKVIPQDGAEKMGFDKVGYLWKRDPHNVGGWKRRWFTLKGKSLVYYRRAELSEIDLRKVTELKPPDTSGTHEAQCSLQIMLEDRVYHLKAETSSEADSWVQALRHTQVSGIPLSQQQITSGGIPIIVHKCLQFVETFGLEVEGIYRMSGNRSKIRKLILGFNQDARGFLIDSEDFTVHDVTGALKDFFKSLPDPLLTHTLYPKFVDIMKVEHEEQLHQLKGLIDQLPPVNRETLKRIIIHLNRVTEHKAKNKMTRPNLVSLFAPTLMTVNADAVSMTNHMHEFACVDKMIECYKWLFEVKDEEEAREKELQEAKKKILEATEKSKVTNVGMTSTMKFLNTIYILSKSGDTYGTYITPETLVGDLIEEVATNKALPPDHYALYLVIGEGDSYRVLSGTDRLLGALSSVGSECYLCLKPNSFFASIKPFMHLDSWDTVQVHVREKRKWKKYPCAIRGNNFVQFKDSKCAHEVARLPVSELDMYVGMEKTIRTDHRNPMPTRNFFWLKPMRGLEEQTKYICTDSEQDLQKLMAALVKAKYGSEGLQAPLLPTRPPHPDMATRRATVNASPRASPSIPKRDQFASSFQYNKH